MTALIAKRNGKTQGEIHADNGQGMPLCSDRNYFSGNDPKTKWKPSKKAVSCHHCKNDLIKLARETAPKPTLRELFYGNQYAKN